MWSINEFSPDEIESQIAGLGVMPVVSHEFRTRVLMQTFSVQQHTQSVQRIQTLTSSLLVLVMLFCLPTYYRFLRDPAAWHVSHRRDLKSPAPMIEPLPQPTPSVPYEWSLVESALTMRYEKAKIVSRTL